MKFFLRPQLLHIAALLELATALIIVGMLNFSIGLLLAIFVTPFALIVNPNAKTNKKRYSFSAIFLNDFPIRPGSLKKWFFSLQFSPFFSHKYSVSQVLCYLFNPMVVLYIALVILTRWSLGDLSFYPLLKRSLSGAMDALTFSIVDSAVSVAQPS